MTTMTMTNQATAAPGRSLEELVDRVMEAVLGQTSREAPQSVARSIHDARRLRRSGDTGGALAVLGGVDVRSATEGEVRWAYSEWLGLARRRFAGTGALLYSQGTGRGAVLVPRRTACSRWRRRSGCGGRPGHTPSRGARSGGYPAAGRGRSMTTATVDLAALKSRHPLGDTVEAAGVELTGRGRVRQGVCPFHSEEEGSFTVYGDTERWYCFGCGLGGDVLDFVQRVEGVGLPGRYAGSSPVAVSPSGQLRPVLNGRPSHRGSPATPLRSPRR